MSFVARDKDCERWFRTLRGRDTFADDIGAIGAWVGPRKGPDRRTHGQKEDYIFRRLLVAWRETKQLIFPVNIRAETDGDGEPDFLLTWDEGETRGIEVTEAGEENYQAWLTQTESQVEESAILMSGDGRLPSGLSYMEVVARRTV